MKWYKRDPDAALVGFRGLSHDAKSAYGTIIDLSYSRDGDVPDDERFLCMHIECRPQWWRRVKQELMFHQKIRIISGKLVANRVETALKEAENFSETQSKRATQGWVSRKNNNENNAPSLPLGNANTTTTTYIKEGADQSSKRGPASALPTGAPARSDGPRKETARSGSSYAVNTPATMAELERAMLDRQKSRLGISPDQGMDYRSPPPLRPEHAHALEPLPDRPMSRNPAIEKILGRGNRPATPETDEEIIARYAALAQPSPCSTCNCPKSASGETICLARAQPKLGNGRAADIIPEQGSAAALGKATERF